MLTLTRRVGESIRIGRTTCITVYDRLRYHVVLGVLTVPEDELHVGTESVRAAVLPDGSCFRMLTLLSGETFALGPARVTVRFRPTFLDARSPLRRQLKVCINAPRDVLILREELHERQQKASGERQPPIPAAEWLRKANSRVSIRMMV